MKPYAIIRQALLGFTGTAIAVAIVIVFTHMLELFRFVCRLMAALSMVTCVALLARPAQASELSATFPARNGIVVHPADEVLRDWCHTDADGRLWFALPGGRSYELITSTSDPSIANHGDGQFHPFDPATVREALAAIRYPLDGVSADVFLLPYPRRAGLSSCAGPGLILLSPGVWTIPAVTQHAELAHELGHVVQYLRLPDSDVADWDAYRSMRGIEDATIYNAGAPHADRPHEIFAEDFRALFGGALAASASGIENDELMAPSTVPGLASFIGGLHGFPVSGFAVAREAHALAFSRAGAVPQTLALYDVTGRRIATLPPVTMAGGMVWRWDGRDASGRTMPSGMVFARLADGSAVTRAVWRP